MLPHALFLSSSFAHLLQWAPSVGPFYLECQCIIFPNPAFTRKNQTQHKWSSIRRTKVVFISGASSTDQDDVKETLCRWCGYEDCRTDCSTQGLSQTAHKCSKFALRSKQSRKMSCFHLYLFFFPPISLSHVVLFLSAKKGFLFLKNLA